MNKSAKKYIRYGADLDFVQKFIEDVQLKVTGAHSILNIYAIAGFGKSDFLACFPHLKN